MTSTKKSYNQSNVVKSPMQKWSLVYVIAASDFVQGQCIQLGLHVATHY
jgi:hypothetical protein